MKPSFSKPRKNQPTEVAIRLVLTSNINLVTSGLLKRKSRPEDFMGDEPCDDGRSGQHQSCSSISPLALEMGMGCDSVPFSVITNMLERERVVGPVLAQFNLGRELMRHSGRGGKEIQVHVGKEGLPGVPSPPPTEAPKDRRGRLLFWLSSCSMATMQFLCCLIKHDVRGSQVRRLLVPSGRFLM